MKYRVLMRKTVTDNEMRELTIVLRKLQLVEINTLLNGSIEEQ